MIRPRRPCNLVVLYVECYPVDVKQPITKGSFPDSLLRTELKNSTILFSALRFSSTLSQVKSAGCE